MDYYGFYIALLQHSFNNSSPLDHRRSGIAKLIGVPSIMARTRVLSHGLDSGKIPGRKKQFGIRMWENSAESYGPSELIVRLE